MGKVTKKEMPIWAKMGHAKPRTRREFLGYGMIPFAARALVPGALGLLTTPFSQANASNCASGVDGSVSLVTLNLAGGAGLSANYMPLDQGGSPLASYSKMGNGSGANIPARISEFGNSHFSTTSQFIVGVRSQASQAARDNTAFIAACVQSRDDSAENASDVSGMAFKSGLVGSLLPNLGTRSSPTGLSNKPSTLSPPPPLVVNNFASIANSIGYTAALRTGLSDSQRNRVAKLASSLTGSQARRLASINSAKHVTSLVECAGIKNTGLIAGGASAVDPLLDPAVGAGIATLYGINAGSTGEARVFSAMVYNALMGNAGTINLERGGYDYHDGTRALGERLDREAGEAVGRMLQMAHLMQKPIFIYVTSDGSVVSTDSASPGSNWISDRGNAGMFYMIMYRPSGRPNVTAPQIGHYNMNQEAEESTPIGNSPETAAQAAFANYTRFAYGSDWESVFRRVIPRGGALDGAVLESVVKVAV
jgi:hypothetical protein